MSSEHPDLTFRPATEDDHVRVQARLGEWWDDWGDPHATMMRTLMLTRLFFQHFNDTSTIVEDESGELRGFLIGFMSQDDPRAAYIHFVGTDPELRGTGVGRALYERFFGQVRERGGEVVRAITGPQNATSIRFHRSMGFSVSEPQPDYDGPGYDRVCFERVIGR
ncbi:GNAT family N-acetyltransferase [Nocardioides sp. NPDC059952]|uniref:GNAT family N-acetyltransferase n=1 Tax=Nocardioides sp. NPDC059952 TaxID=3347014 RepID=UPI003656F82D